MNTLLLVLSVVCLATSANAKARHYNEYEDRYAIPIETTSSYGDDIFGQSGSGIAPSPSITQGRSISVAPLQDGSKTGGVDN